LASSALELYQSIVAERGGQDRLTLQQRETRLALVRCYGDIRGADAATRSQLITSLGKLDAMLRPVEVIETHLDVSLLDDADREQLQALMAKCTVPGAAPTVDEVGRAGSGSCPTSGTS